MDPGPDLSFSLAEHFDVGITRGKCGLDRSFWRPSRRVTSRLVSRRRLHTVHHGQKAAIVPNDQAARGDVPSTVDSHGDPDRHRDPGRHRHSRLRHRLGRHHNEDGDRVLRVQDGGV